MPVPGLVAIAGGKYTTYRVMAKDAVDAAVRSLDRRVPPSVTHETPLVGADGYLALRNRNEALAAETGLHPARIEHLLGRFGSRIFELTAEIARDPELAEPLPGADDYLAAEVRHAVTHEGAQHLEDVLTRRTRISIEAWDRGLASAEPAARLMADVARLGRGHGRPRGRPLPRPRRRRARVPGDARRPGRRRRPDERPRRAARFAAGRALAAFLLSPTAVDLERRNRCERSTAPSASRRATLRP